MIPNGYKQTEVGVIPEDWDCVQLGNIAKVTKLAGFEFTKYIVYSEQGDIIAIRGLNVKNGALVLDDVKYIDNSDFSKLSRSKLFKNDLLFTYVGTVGEAALVDKNDKYYLAPNVALIRLNPEMFPAFCMKQILSTNFYKNQIHVQIATSSQPALSMANIRLFSMVLPPLPEQERIAEALSDVDSMISSLEKLITKKKAVKQGAMQELLTGKKRLPEFYGEWVEVTMDSYVDFQVGFPFSSAYFNNGSNGLRLIKNRDLKSDDQIYYTSETYASEYVVENGDILVGMDGDFLPCKWHKGKALLNQRVGRLLPKKNLDGLFAYYALQKPLAELQNGTGATTVKHLSHGDIKKLVVSMPPTKEEQTAIASILSNIDNEIEVLEHKLEKTRQVKQGMMQQLLTGKIRLV